MSNRNCSENNGERVKDPIVFRTKGRPSGTSLCKKRARCCEICHGTGHNKRSSKLAGVQGGTEASRGGIVENDSSSFGEEDEGGLEAHGRGMGMNEQEDYVVSYDFDDGGTKAAIDDNQAMLWTLDGSDKMEELYVCCKARVFLYCMELCNSAAI